MIEPCDLFTKIPREELNRLFEESEASAELDFSYLGFEDVYQKVLEIAPKNMIVLDLGCAYATQSWYFRDHKEYIGVDYGPCMRKNPTYEDNLKCVIHTENSRYFFESIQSFIQNTLPTLGLNLNNVFAVCSAVPDNEARQMVRDTFPNYLDWYPSEETKIVWNHMRIKDEETFVYWNKCKEELISYAKENNIDLYVEEDPLGFELLVDKYAEMKKFYKEYSKEEIIRDAIEEWNMEQEADLI